MSEEKLVTVYTAYDPPNADMIRMFLDAEGIPAILDNEHQAGLSGAMPIKVQVRASDAERAKEFIRSHEESHRPDEDA